MPKWKDVSSYSRDEKDRTPRTWEVRVGDLRIVVTRLHLQPGSWFLCTFPNHFTDVGLDTDDAEVAKEKGWTIVKLHITQLLNRMREAS